MNYEIHNLSPAVEDLATEPYISKREVARRLGRTIRAVDKMMKRRRIPYYKFDWRVAFRWSEIQEHLAQTCRVDRHPLAKIGQTRSR